MSGRSRGSPSPPCGRSRARGGGGAGEGRAVRRRSHRTPARSDAAVHGRGRPAGHHGRRARAGGGGRGGAGRQRRRQRGRSAGRGGRGHHLRLDGRPSGPHPGRHPAAACRPSARSRWPPAWRRPSPSAGTSKPPGCPSSWGSNDASTRPTWRPGVSSTRAPSVTSTSCHCAATIRSPPPRSSSPRPAACSGTSPSTTWTSCASSLAERWTRSTSSVPSRGFPLYEKYDDLANAVAVMRLDDGTPVALSWARHDPLGHDVRTEVFGSRDSVAVGLGPRMPMRSVEPGVPAPAGTTLAHLPGPLGRRLPGRAHRVPGRGPRCATQPLHARRMAWRHCASPRR